ncbi:MerR family transcriptional regulator [Streptomyces sp. PU-14G]|uniref:MerR family transcriptional regulator n=1 Tax=Streptomyces sp. PU-14G TaxID=2800808 RepID=UPI0034DF1E90
MSFEERNEQSPDTAAADNDLLPIEEVARNFGLNTSALRYYERRGLLQPAARRGGKRWYGPAEVRQLALISFWQRCGLMGLTDIATLIARQPDTPNWKQVVDGRIAALDTQIQQMTTARDYLQHLTTCPRKHSLDGCPYFEEVIRQFPQRRAAPTDPPPDRSPTS